MFVTEDIRYIGVNDHDVDLFEGQYTVENGMSYNSYVILDEKVAVMDTVDAHFGVEWLQNLETELNGRRPDYLVVQHMEPDHSANIAVFMEDVYKRQDVKSAVPKRQKGSVPDETEIFSRLFCASGALHRSRARLCR